MLFAMFKTTFSVLDCHNVRNKCKIIYVVYYMMSKIKINNKLAHFFTAQYVHLPRTKYTKKTIMSYWMF